MLHLRVITKIVVCSVYIYIWYCHLVKTLYSESEVIVGEEAVIEALVKEAWMFDSTQ